MSKYLVLKDDVKLSDLEKYGFKRNPNDDYDEDEFDKYGSYIYEGVSETMVKDYDKHIVLHNYWWVYLSHSRHGRIIHCEYDTYLTSEQKSFCEHDYTIQVLFPLIRDGFIKIEEN